MTTTTNNAVSFFSLTLETTTPVMSTLVALDFARALTDAARKAETRNATPANDQIVAKYMSR